MANCDPPLPALNSGAGFPWRIGRPLIATLFMLAHAQGAAAEECGELANGYGPYDYWTDKDKLPVVEKYHFAPQVETLKGGQSSYIGGDIAYVLRAFPNHPRALIAMMRLAQKENRAVPEGAVYSVNCYFERAIRFRPKDTSVRVIYGNFLLSTGRAPEALRSLLAARDLGSKGPEFDYDLGMAYLETGDFENALACAHRAYKGGVPMVSLKLKLTRAGRWKEPEIEPSTAPSSAKQRAAPLPNRPSTR